LIKFRNKISKLEHSRLELCVIYGQIKILS